jgi:hypothetical protein
MKIIRDPFDGKHYRVAGYAYLLTDRIVYILPPKRIG